MKWTLAAAAAVVVAANTVVLISARRERAAPVARLTIDVCAGHLMGGSNSTEPPALRLIVRPESLSIPPGLDPAGLRALGFAEPAIAAVGRVRDSTFHWSRPRPAWVRLRQEPDSLSRFAVVQVAPRRELLAPDSTSLVLRARIWFSQRRGTPPPAPAAGPDHAAGGRMFAPGVIYPAVAEIIPFLLHLDRRQSAKLGNSLAGSTGCAARQRVVIATGKNGSIWVESVP